MVFLITETTMPSHYIYLCQNGTMKWIVSTGNLYVEALIPSVTKFGRSCYKEVIEVSKTLRMGPWYDRINVLIRGDFWAPLLFSPLTLHRLHEWRSLHELTRWQLSTCQEEWLYQKMPCWHPDFSLQDSRIVTKCMSTDQGT